MFFSHIGIRCTTVWDILPSLATPMYRMSSSLLCVQFVHTAYHSLVKKRSWVKHTCSPKKGVDAFSSVSAFIHERVPSLIITKHSLQSFLWVAHFVHLLKEYSRDTSAFPSSLGSKCRWNTKIAFHSSTMQLPMVTLKYIEQNFFAWT